MPGLIVPGTVAIAAAGSFGRGNPGPESDVDITRFLNAVPESEPDRYRIEYQGGRMVAVFDDTLENVRDGLAVPERAVWTVPYLLSTRALYDPAGELAQLQDAARSFQWAPLQPAANRYSGHRLMKFAEESLKLALALRAGDEPRIATETTWLVLGLPLLIAVQRGIFLDNESRAPLQVQESAGRESLWSKRYRVAAGIGGASSLKDRGRAALDLYALTADLLGDILLPEHRTVIDETLDRAGTRKRPWG